MRSSSKGFNLIELMLSMSLATILFMAITVLYVKQGDVITQQNDVLDMNREARFAIDHLRRDLASLGSNSTPNSDADPLVCPKPDTSIRALQVTVGSTSFVAAGDLNPGVRPAALTLFGSLDVKRRFKTSSIQDTKVFLFDDPNFPLPKSQLEFDQIFTTDRWLRLAGGDGTQMFFRIVSGSAADSSVTVTSPIPRQGEGQVCGYAGFGENYQVDVQGFVRYRIVPDTRPGSPTLPTSGLPSRGLLVRERLLADGQTLLAQTILAENAVDFTLYDALLDIDGVPEKASLFNYKVIDSVTNDAGLGVLGFGPEAKPEQLRAVSVKVSLRSEWPDRDLAHQPRQSLYAPINTYQLANDGRGAHRVVSLGTRVFLPTLESRNL